MAMCVRVRVRVARDHRILSCHPIVSCHLILHACAIMPPASGILDADDSEYDDDLLDGALPSRGHLIHQDHMPRVVKPNVTYKMKIMLSCE